MLNAGRPIPAPVIQVALAARRHGLIIRPLGDSILFVPPISIQADEVKHLVRAVRLAMEETLEGLSASEASAGSSAAASTEG